MPAVSTGERDERVGRTAYRRERLDEEIDAADIVERYRLIAVVFDDGVIGWIAEATDVADENIIPVPLSGGHESDLRCPVSIVGRFLENDEDKDTDEDDAEDGEEKRHRWSKGYLFQYIRKQPRRESGLCFICIDRD